MLSKQEEMLERRRTLENDRKLLREQGTTFHQFAQADAEVPRDRFAAVNAATVIGSKATIASAYPAASSAHQIQLPDEPPLSYDNPALERQRRVDEMNGMCVLPAGTTARQFMQMVMRGEIEPTHKQFIAAKELIAYEEPKLSAVAVGHMDGTSFAAALERAIMRSQQPPPKAALLPPPEHPASELKGNFPMRRRNLR